MQIQITTPPDYLPVSVAVVKDYLDVGFDTHNDLIENLIKSSTRRVEEYCSTSLQEQTLTVFFEYDKDGEYTLPNAPHKTLTSFKSIYKEGVETDLVLNTDFYKVGLTSFTLETSKIDNAFQAVYVAGYDTIPTPILEAIKMMVKDQYDHRGAIMDGSYTMSQEVKSKLAPFRKYLFF
jgi:uncharacterized phiE125 gp8 family phage protein